MQPFDVNRIKEIEEETRHDVVAFTRAVSESLGEERKWVHYGLTSNGCRRYSFILFIKASKRNYFKRY